MRGGNSVVRKLSASPSAKFMRARCASQRSLRENENNASLRDCERRQSERLRQIMCTYTIHFFRLYVVAAKYHVCVFLRAG